MCCPRFLKLQFIALFAHISNFDQVDFRPISTAYETFLSGSIAIVTTTGLSNLFDVVFVWQFWWNRLFLVFSRPPSHYCSSDFCFSAHGGVIITFFQRCFVCVSHPFLSYNFRPRLLCSSVIILTDLVTRLIIGATFLFLVMLFYTFFLFLGV